MAVMYVPIHLDTMDWLMPLIFVIASIAQLWAGGDIYTAAWTTAKHGGTSMNTYPARVFKGKRMAGRMGGERSTSRNLRVVRVDQENNLLLVRGAIPGPNGGYLIIRQTNTL